MSINKKVTPNKMVTMYLPKRDYVDHTTHTDPIDGVVLVDPSIKNGKVNVKLVCAFQYGREDLDSLGVRYTKNYCDIVQQVYPPTNSSSDKPNTVMQDKLLRKLGENAYPFTVEIPTNSPCSVSLQAEANDQSDRNCGIHYQLITFVVDPNDDTKIDPKSSATFKIRKIQYAPECPGSAPRHKEDLCKKEKPFSADVSLNKDLYYHGEEISVSVKIENKSGKNLKKIRLTVDQFTDVCLFKNAQYSSVVASQEFSDQVPTGTNFNKAYSICPQLSDNKNKGAVAMDGQLKKEDTNLASSTLEKSGVGPDDVGIVVKYKINCIFCFGAFGGEQKVVLPVVLMHPKPCS